MNIKLNVQKKTEDELDVEAFERDVALFDYLDRVEKNQLTDEEKKQRQNFYDSIGFKKEK
jgi:hypothetical protein